MKKLTVFLSSLPLLLLLMLSFQNVILCQEEAVLSEGATPSEGVISTPTTILSEGVLPSEGEISTPTEATIESEEELLHEEEEEETEILGIILYIFFGLLTGIMTKFALSWLPVPYTCWLMIWGLIIGIVEYQGGANWPHMAEGIRIIMSMPPELFLLIFLPPIILASGISMDWHILKRNMGQVLLLATVGVVIGAGLIAVVVKYLFDYNWAWDEALTVGSMMAATDPVAVVALLKEVGASKRLGIVIEGESLFNDGTAQVFFLLFKEMIVGKERPFGSAVGFFCQLSLGGPAIGFGVGLLVYFFLTFVYNDFSVEISITLCSAYLCYFLSEEIGGASGILAVVTLGIFMAALGKFAITPKVKEPLAIFWEMLEYLFNTVLFVYAGTVIGEVLYGVQDTTNGLAESVDTEASQFSRDIISGKDWGFAFMLYVLLQVIRAITIGALYPFLARMGYGLTWKDAVVMTWGGLRGAVGLALALQLYLDPEIDNVFGTQVLFHMGLMAVLTLLINGTTTPVLLKMLGVTAPSPEKLDTLVSIVHEMENYADRHLDHLRHDALMGDPDWDLVLKSSEVKVESVLPGNVKDNNQNKLGTNLPGQNKRGLKNLRGALGQSMKRLPSSKDLLDICPMVLLAAARTRYLMVVKATYAEGYEKGYIGVDEVTDLLESADRTLDKVENEMSDWNIVEQFLQVSWFKRIAAVISRKLGIQRLCKMMLYWDLNRSAVLASSFVFAHREAQRVMDDYITFQVTRQDVDKDLQEVKLQQYEKLCNESNEQIEEAVKYLKQLKLAFPEVMRAIKTRQVTQTILRHKEKFVEEIHHSGSIEEKEAHQLESLVERKMKKLLYSSPHIKSTAPVDLLREHFLFNEIDSQLFYRDILPRAEMQVIDENKTVFQAGEAAEHLYIVVQGIVRVEHESHPPIVTESIGALVGITSVVLKRPRTRSMYTETPIVVYRIGCKDFGHMMGQYHTVYLRAWQTVGAALAMLHGQHHQRLMHYTELLDVYRKARMNICEPQDWVRIPGEAMLVQGCLRGSDGELVKATAAIHDGPKEFQALEHSLVLILSEAGNGQGGGDHTGRRRSRRSSAVTDLVLGGHRGQNDQITRASSQTPTHPLVQRCRSITPRNTDTPTQYADYYRAAYHISDGGYLQRDSGPTNRGPTNNFSYSRPQTTETKAASMPLPTIPLPAEKQDAPNLQLPQIKEISSFKFSQQP